MRTMMWLPFLVGAAAVLQGGLNRRIADVWGLAPAVMLNSAVFVVAGLGLLAIAWWRPDWLPSLFLQRAGATPQWWWILPGLLGFGLVVGIPWAISNLGALRVFVGIVAGQMVVGLAWDQWVEGIELTTARLAAAALAVAAVALAR